MSVNNSTRSGSIIWIFFTIFFNITVCFVFSLESPHRGDSNAYTQHTIINMKTKFTLNHPKYNCICSYGIFLSQGLKNEFEIAMVNEPSVFGPLEFYCINTTLIVLQWTSLAWRCSNKTKICKWDGKQCRLDQTAPYEQSYIGPHCLLTPICPSTWSFTVMTVCGCHIYVVSVSNQYIRLPKPADWKHITIHLR